MYVSSNPISLAKWLYRREGIGKFEFKSFAIRACAGRYVQYCTETEDLPKGSASLIYVSSLKPLMLAQVCLHQLRDPCHRSKITVTSINMTGKMITALLVRIVMEADISTLVVPIVD